MQSSSARKEGAIARVKAFPSNVRPSSYDVETVYVIQPWDPALKSRGGARPIIPGTELALNLAIDKHGFYTVCFILCFNEGNKVPVPSEVFSVFCSKFAIMGSACIQAVEQLTGERIRIGDVLPHTVFQSTSIPRNFKEALFDIDPNLINVTVVGNRDPYGTQILDMEFDSERREYFAEIPVVDTSDQLPILGQPLPESFGTKQGGYRMMKVKVTKDGLIPVSYG